MIASEEYGGAAGDYVSYALALIEVAAADGALSTIVSIQNSIMVAGLLKDGTTEQRERFLPELIAGRLIGPFALTEADAGSDASAIRTRATKVEGGWKVVRPYVRLCVRGGSPYTACPRVARVGRADPHRRRANRGSSYRGFRRHRRGEVAQRDRDRGWRAWRRGAVLG